MWAVESTLAGWVLLLVWGLDLLLLFPQSVPHIGSPEDCERDRGDDEGGDGLPSAWSERAMPPSSWCPVTPRIPTLSGRDTDAIAGRLLCKVGADVESVVS